MGQLETLARKELRNEPFTEDERLWLQKMVSEGGNECNPPIRGWYANLFFEESMASKGSPQAVKLTLVR